MQADSLAFVAILATCFMCGAWFGWFAGYRYGRARAMLRRPRERRMPTVNIDYEFAAAAFRRSGYEIVPTDGRKVH